MESGSVSAEDAEEDERDDKQKVDGNTDAVDGNRGQGFAQTEEQEEVEQ